MGKDIDIYADFSRVCKTIAIWIKVNTIYLTLNINTAFIHLYKKDTHFKEIKKCSSTVCTPCSYIMLNIAGNA